MESNRNLSKILIGCGVAFLLVIFLAIGLVGGYAGHDLLNNLPLLANVTQPQNSTTTPNTDELFIPFWEAWSIVHNQFIDQPVDDEKMMQGAIRGMMDSLGDPHSGYMDPVEYSDAQAPLEGYSGIGAWVNTEGEYLTITEPIKDSPAEAAGLKSGDQIIAIDGVDMTGTLAELARQKVLGPAGTQVLLTIRREGVEEPFDIPITRAQITIPSTEYKMLENNIAYVRLNAFSSTTGDELRSALQDLMAHNPQSLILDLRYNGGGYLDEAIQVGSEFLADGVVAYEEFGDGTRNTFTASGDGIATKIPMLVLVNEWSASASEVVAGALQDRGRAQLVGVTTFGKGTAQNWIALSDNEGAVRVTMARWLTPNMRNVSGTGLTPDVEVSIPDTDAQAGVDTQLNKAIEILSQP
ncbi:MAG: S41 family peptidase [Anaerolineales bacterium]|nr:MAG: S41 family peptidase [Anaerolineales bacterium]